ncbi:MAG: AAA family ATPase, partial [Actinobacteria bacterium]|nr:AAA family ATPase [Actinomycetota bacterium]
MLKHVKVSNIALIEEATLTLSPGLTVLSGETGTGKTALLFSLKLLIGERADSFMIRDGAEMALVEGVFEEDGATLRVRRRLGSDGRSRCWIDDESVTVATLAQRIGPLIDLYGQHDHQSLLSPSSHLKFLDMWIGRDASTARSAYGSAYEAYSRAQKRHNDLIAASSATKRDLELARFALREIEAVGAYDGEYEVLEQELPALQHADALASAANEAYEAIRNDGGANDILGDCLGVLTREAGIDVRLDDLADRLGEIVMQTEEIASDFRAYRDSLDFDPDILAGKLERLHVLDGICKKYGPRMQDVFERESQARCTIDLV